MSGFRLVASLVLVMVIFFGCKESTGKTVKIGLLAPVTGEFSYEGDGFRRSVELRANQVNAEGGLLGKPAELVVRDDRGNPEEAVRAAQQLIDKGVRFVVGSYSSTCTEPAAALFNENGVLQITPSSTATRLTQKGYQRFFRTCFLDERQGEYAAKFIRAKLGAQMVAILHDDSTYARGLADAAKKHLELKGSKVIFFGAINPEDKDFTPVIVAIREHKPEVLFFSGYLAQAGAILKQAHALGCEFNIVMGDACNNPELVTIAGKESAAGAYFITEPLPADIPYPRAKTFVADFFHVYRQPPASIWWMAAADAFNVIVEGIRHAASEDPGVVAKYLHASFKDYDGVTGPILGFDEKGDRKGTIHIAYRIEPDGSFVMAP